MENNRKQKFNFELITAAFTPLKQTKSSSNIISISSTKSQTNPLNIPNRKEKLENSFDIGALKADLSEIYNNLDKKSKKKLLDTNIQLSDLEKNQKEAVYKVMLNFPLSRTNIYENRVLTDLKSLGKKPRDFLKNFTKLEKEKEKEEKWMKKRREGLLRKKLAIFERKMRIKEINQEKKRWFRNIDRENNNVRKINISAETPIQTQCINIETLRNKVKDLRFNEVSLPQIFSSKRESLTKKKKNKIKKKFKNLMNGVFQPKSQRQ